MLLHLLALHVAVRQYLVADVPNPGNPIAPPGVASDLNTVLAWLKYLGLAAVIAGIFMVAIRMALSHRQPNPAGEHVAALGLIAGSLVLLGAASAIVGFFAT